MNKIADQKYETIFYTFIIALCWGSFLNVIAYRLTFDKPFFTKRSYCPKCNALIAWYDNIPLISWIVLRGKCRSCKSPISILYPFIELLTGIIGTALWFNIFPCSFTAILLPTFFAYTLFFSALIVATRTDLEAMIIPQIVSLWLVPLGLLFAYSQIINITIYESIFGTIIGYGSLWLIAKIFKFLTKKDGLGIGDMELLALIGAFLGPLAIWASVLIGSISGLIVGGSYLIISKGNRSTRIPFGPFLALGATLFFFFEAQIINLLLL